MIGTFGLIVFAVSESQVKTFDGLSRTEAGRWAKHDVVGKKPIAEFLGPDLSTLAFTMRFDVMHGINPRKESDDLIRMARDGKAYQFILGGRRFGLGKWSLQDVKVDFLRVDNRGNVLVAQAAVSLEEYV
ncbi:phage tail protein [Sporosarcina sp. FSL K6-5500]|uniref:phage tail protein n=1 Tax=Sporosarcina sp. FSL K6-5500 TaxID=2921558 RepID=UPI0030F7426E